MASSPFMLAAELVYDGELPKKLLNWTDSYDTVKYDPAATEIAGNVNSCPSVPPPLLADPIP